MLLDDESPLDFNDSILDEAQEFESAYTSPLTKHSLIMWHRPEEQTAISQLEDMALSLLSQLSLSLPAPPDDPLGETHEASLKGIQIPLTNRTKSTRDG